MKRHQLLIVTIAVAITQSLLTQTSQAQDAFRVLVNTVSISTNETGQLTRHQYGNREIIRDCAADHGITNLTGLSLVYDRSADAVQVVAGTNHTVICTPLTFSGGVSLSNSNATKTERLAFVFADSSQVANGTLAATEHLYYGSSNQLVWHSLKGRLQYAVPGNETNVSTIYNGIIVTSANSSRDDNDDDDDDDGLNTSGSSWRHR
jgi:hypothetical protein